LDGFKNTPIYATTYEPRYNSIQIFHLN